VSFCPKCGKSYAANESATPAAGGVRLQLPASFSMSKIYANSAWIIRIVAGILLLLFFTAAFTRTQISSWHVDISFTLWDLRGASADALRWQLNTDGGTNLVVVFPIILLLSISALFIFAKSRSAAIFFSGLGIVLMFVLAFWMHENANDYYWVYQSWGFGMWAAGALYIGIIVLCWKEEKIAFLRSEAKVQQVLKDSSKEVESSPDK